MYPLPWILYGAGFNVETVEYKRISFTVWDVGEQEKVQSLICFAKFAPLGVY